ncbi:MAG TPA: DsbA family protein [Caulobacteraceae bacterium]|nr:DsbA family protein [Caulobacteraceae bacterium]
MGRLSRLASTVIALSALALAACNKADNSAMNADEMSLGNPQAKVTVVEYASASCPHCARFNNEVFPAFKAKYIDTGRIHYVFREFLTPPMQFAAAGFLVARCAGKDKYFSVLDTIYHDQAQIYQSGDLRGGLLKIAQSTGMTEQQFDNCISNTDALKALNDRVQKAQDNDHIDGTPTFVINGKQAASGEMTLGQLDDAIKAAGG